MTAYSTAYVKANQAQDGLMELLEAAGDRAQTARDEANKHTARAADAAGWRNAADACRFMTAGNATVTLHSATTGARFTYRLRKSDDGRMVFVSVLTGPDNESSYQYLGQINLLQNIFWHGRKSRIATTAPSAKGFAWAWQNLAGGHVPPALTVWHAGKCGRCGRTLTVPESIESGYGPECIGKVML